MNTYITVTPFLRVEKVPFATKTRRRAESVPALLCCRLATIRRSPGLTNGDGPRMADEQPAPQEQQASEAQPASPEPSPAEISWIGTEEVRGSIPPEIKFGSREVPPEPLSGSDG
jgi:hypothetical protein